MSGTHGKLRNGPTCIALLLPTGNRQTGRFQELETGRSQELEAGRSQELDDYPG